MYQKRNFQRNFRRNFLWGSSEGSFKYPLVAWEKVCVPVELGGLGIRSVASFNQALLGKWLWHFGMKLPIFGGELSPQNMVRVKGGGVRKCVGGLMDVAFGEAFMKGGRVSLSICLL